MSNRLVRLIVVGVLAAGIGGCIDFGAPNDTEHAQERSRLDRPPPTPTELPPGLAPDLPAPPTTGPASSGR